MGIWDDLRKKVPSIKISRFHYLLDPFKEPLHAFGLFSILDFGKFFHEGLSAPLAWTCNFLPKPTEDPDPWIGGKQRLQEAVEPLPNLWSQSFNGFIILHVPGNAPLPNLLRKHPLSEQSLKGLGSHPLINNEILAPVQNSPPLRPHSVHDGVVPVPIHGIGCFGKLPLQKSDICLPLPIIAPPSCLSPQREPPANTLLEVSKTTLTTTEIATVPSSNIDLVFSIDNN